MDNQRVHFAFTWACRTLIASVIVVLYGLIPVGIGYLVTCSLWYLPLFPLWAFLVLFGAFYLAWPGRVARV